MNSSPAAIGQLPVDRSVHASTTGHPPGKGSGIPPMTPWISHFRVEVALPDLKLIWPRTVWPFWTSQRSVVSGLQFSIDTEMMVPPVEPKNKIKFFFVDFCNVRQFLNRF